MLLLPIRKRDSTTLDCTHCREVDLSGLCKQAQQTEQEIYVDVPVGSRGKAKDTCAFCALLLQCGRMSDHPGLAENDSSSHLHDELPSWLEKLELGRDNAPIQALLPCRLRPKLISCPSSDKNKLSTNDSSVQYGSQIEVWFHEFKESKVDYIRRKGRSRGSVLDSETVTPESYTMGLDGPSNSSNAKSLRSRLGRFVRSSPMASEAPVKSVRSAVASWRLDIVDSPGTSFFCNRRPLLARTDVRVLQSWLKQCQQGHSHPVQIGDISKPLTELPLTNSLRAIDTSDGCLKMLDARAPFAALSYVWGSATAPGTSWSDEHPRHPPTVRDAILLARQLGFRWLWVDRICINQSDDGEKALLIPYMKDIFAAADLTIVAACGTGADCGLLGVGETNRAPEVPIERIDSFGTMRLLPAPMSFNAMLQGSCWRSRGWTFEEHVFSRRLLYVFPSEIFFSCAHGTYREATQSLCGLGSAGCTWGDGGRTPPTIVGELHAKFHSSILNTSRRVNAREYVRALEEYTRRELSLEQDRVKAFAGVVAAAGPLTKPGEDESLILHGHPLPYFETIITWCYDPDHAIRTTCERQRFAPSWSWASSLTNVRFLDKGDDDGRNRWFSFAPINSSNILGLPRPDCTNHFSLPLPTALLETMPPSSVWRDWSTLHLLTITFQSSRLGREWYLDKDCPKGSRQKWERGTTEAPSHTLALVGGYKHIYVMLLGPGSFPNTYRRHGIARWDGLLDERTLDSIMASGSASWRFIEIA